MSSNDLLFVEIASSLVASVAHGRAGLEEDASSPPPVSHGIADDPPPPSSLSALCSHGMALLLVLLSLLLLEFASSHGIALLLLAPLTSSVDSHGILPPLFEPLCIGGVDAFHPPPLSLLLSSLSGRNVGPSSSSSLSGRKVDPSFSSSAVLSQGFPPSPDGTGGVVGFQLEPLPADGGGGVVGFHPPEYFSVTLLFAPEDTARKFMTSVTSPIYTLAAKSLAPNSDFFFDDSSLLGDCSKGTSMPKRLYLSLASIATFRDSRRFVTYLAKAVELTWCRFSRRS
mmetsp:Transcript_26170/g.61481  ORF Transcript_26170/g.61481 Transcript_26170/m.61481 type:complete len:284 (-) Transcript_26170:575-1426(-)